MNQFIRNNHLFFICLGLFLLLGGIHLLIAAEKHTAILFFSQNRNLYADLFFTYVTRLGEEFMYILIFLAFLTYKVRYSILIALTGFTVMGTSHLLKSFFSIDRPLAYLRKLEIDDLITLVDGIDVHTGATSFPSGHSMSAFALYSLLIFILPNKNRFVLPLFITAMLVAFSRVYLVQHFWEDIYAGSMVGVCIAMILYLGNRKIAQDPGHWLNRPLVQRKRRTAEKEPVE